MSIRHFLSWGSGGLFTAPITPTITVGPTYTPGVFPDVGVALTSDVSGIATVEFIQAWHAGQVWTISGTAADCVMPIVYNGKTFQRMQAGTAGGTQPAAFATAVVDDLITDNGVAGAWKCIAVTPLYAWSLSEAAAHTVHSLTLDDSDGMTAGYLYHARVRVRATLGGLYSAWSSDGTFTPDSAVIFDDTFTDTDGVALTSHVPDTQPSALWETPVGTWSISGNAVTSNSSGSSDVAVRNASNANVRVDAWLKDYAANQTTSLLARYSASNNLLGFLYMGDGVSTGFLRLYTTIGGVFAQAGSDITGLAINSSSKVSMSVDSANDVRFYVNDVLVGTINSPAGAGNTKHGTCHTEAGSTIRYDRIKITTNTI